jgi:transposase
LEDADKSLPSLFSIQLSLLQHHMAYFFDGVAARDKQIEQCYRLNLLCQRIIKIPGIGPIAATALIVAVGNASNFENGCLKSIFVAAKASHHAPACCIS